jgi:hypothetical protein
MLSRLKHLNVFIKDPNKKSLVTILKEVIIFWFTKKSLPTDYFRKFLYRADIKNYLDYLSIKEHYAIIESKKIVYPEISHILNNKLSFKLLCQTYQIKVPETLGYNIKANFINKKDHTQITTVEALITFFEKLFIETKKEHLFIKPLEGIGGFGCILLTNKQLKAQIKTHASYLLSTSNLFESYIKQHTEINNIYPHAVNTLRMVHYTDKNHNIHILSTFMRFGQGLSNTDNTSGGGFSVAINQDNGTLFGPGRQEITKGAAVYWEHPDTHYKFEGFTIPYFKEACHLVNTCAKHFPSRLIGWDIAITEEGPVVIEGNHNPGLHVSDIAYGGYKKNPLIKEMLNEIKN